MALYSIGEIATILNPVTSSTEISDPSFSISHLLTDSRSLTYPESTLFFAITTESGDGHRYIDQLYRSGVRAFVVSAMPGGSYPGASFIVVDDPLKALQMLSTTNRDRHGSIPVIAITGSRGKTTVKELLFQLLGHTHSIARSPVASTHASVYLCRFGKSTPTPTWPSSKPAFHAAGRWILWPQ